MCNRQGLEPKVVRFQSPGPEQLCLGDCHWETEPEGKASHLCTISDLASVQTLADSYTHSCLQSWCRRFHSRHSLCCIHRCLRRVGRTLECFLSPKLLLRFNDCHRSIKGWDFAEAIKPRGLHPLGGIGAIIKWVNLATFVFSLSCLSHILAQQKGLCPMPAFCCCFPASRATREWISIPIN